MPDPDLSLVAAFRNEQYGGDLFARARSFLRNVAWLTRRQRARVEVIPRRGAPERVGLAFMPLAREAGYIDTADSEAVVALTAA